MLPEECVSVGDFVDGSIGPQALTENSIVGVINAVLQPSFQTLLQARSDVTHPLKPQQGHSIVTNQGNKGALDSKINTWRLSGLSTGIQI